jgi:peptidoglycan/LPS O-acetylase OafA/YrhL
VSAEAAVEQRRLRGIDGLRAVAAMSVVGYHAWLYTLPAVSAANRDSTGDYVWHELRLGLVLFFVLSGFLLYGPWVAAARGERPAPSWRAFGVRRAARILPAYWLAIVGAILLLWPHDGVPGVRLPPAHDLWLFAIFGQNFTEHTLLTLNSPTWTLAVEAMFYVTLPLLGALALRWRRPGILIVPVLFLLVGVLYNRAIADHHEFSLSVTKVLPAFTPYFAVGMAAAVFARGRLLSRPALWTLLIAGAVQVLGDGLWAANGARHGSHDLALRVWRDLPAAAGFACWMVAVAAASQPLRVLVARPMVWLGTISYGIYLWHVPVLLMLRAHSLLPTSPFLALPIAIPITLAIASASWYWVEKPAQARARGFARRLERPDPPPSVVAADAPA